MSADPNFLNEYKSTILVYGYIHNNAECIPVDLISYMSLWFVEKTDILDINNFDHAQTNFILDTKNNSLERNIRTNFRYHTAFGSFIISKHIHERQWRIKILKVSYPCAKFIIGLVNTKYIQPTSRIHFAGYNRGYGIDIFDGQPINSDKPHNTCVLNELFKENDELIMRYTTIYDKNNYNKVHGELSFAKYSINWQFLVTHSNIALNNDESYKFSISLFDEESVQIIM